MIKTIFTVCFILLFTITCSYSQDSTRAPKKKITALGTNLYEVTLVPVNVVASIGTDGILIVDANYREYGKFLKNTLDSISGGKKLEFIINTHWHFDHTGGQKVFGSGVKIISQKKVRELLSKDDILLGDTQKAYPEYALPNITFDDKYELRFNGEDIKIISMSGSHSAGDAIVYFKKSGVVHIGDIIFADEFPFVDIEHGGSVVTILESLRKIISTMPPDVKIVPGHGPVYSISDLKEYADMVEKTMGIVKKEKDAGKSLEEIQKTNVLNEFKELGVSFSCNDWIEYIYKSLN
jgi:cyclase